MKTEPLPRDEAIEINVDGSANSFPPSLSLLHSAAGVCPHIRNVEEVKGHAFLREPRPLASPVTEQVGSLATLEQCSAWIGSRRTRYNGVRHRHTHFRQRWRGEYQRQNNQKPKRRPVAAARCCFGELTCLNVQFGVFSSVASFHGGIITARALPKLERRWNRTRCDCFCDPRRAYFRLFVQLTLERHDFDKRSVGGMTEKRKLKGYSEHTRQVS